MRFKIPVSFQPEVGQVQEFTVKGEVISLEIDPDNIGRHLATIEVKDALAESTAGGFSPIQNDRTISLRGEMRGG